MGASIIAALAAVIAAFVSAFASVRVAKISRKASEQQERALKHEEEISKHNERREREAVLQGKMITALGELENVTAIAVKGGHTNGNMEAAQEKLNKAIEDYDNFLKEVGLKEILN